VKFFTSSPVAADAGIAKPARASAVMTMAIAVRSALRMP
jgi:hypothetical protein